MLVTFAVENWKSFKERSGFSMESGERNEDEDREERVPVCKRLGMRILPLTVIWGPNAGGKSNLFDALAFMRDCVLGHPEDEPILAYADPYRLDPETVSKPIRFEAELLSHEKLYDFCFAVRGGAIVEERLARHTKSSEILLYERGQAGFKFGKTQENTKQLDQAAEATPDDRLFLSMCPSLGIDNYRDVSDWFEKTLILVSPDERIGLKMLLEDPRIYSVMQQLLPWLGTGISRISQEKRAISDLSLPASLLEELYAQAREGEYRELPAPYTAPRDGLVTLENGELVATKIVPYYSSEDGGEVRMNLDQVSRGTLHLINFLPSLILLARRGACHTAFIDELDYSLHSHLSQELLHKYLAGCTANSRSQLIFTAHDTLLMDQHLLRRDEMWVSEKDFDGKSRLIPLSSFSGIDDEKDVRPLYNDGHLWGTPQFMCERSCIPSA